MKKIYVLACTALIAGTALAQKTGLQEIQGKAATLRQENHTPATFDPNVERDVFWTNDFSQPTDWLIQNAPDIGENAYVDLQWEIGVGLAPEGFAAIDPIASTTADNGFAMVDSDEFGGEEGGTGVENCWIETVNPIDCSEQLTVAIGFLNQYYMWDGGGSDGNEYCLLEVSLDGTTWPDINSFEVADADPGTRYELWPDMATQDAVDNPTYKFFDLTSIAAGEETVYLRFRWKGTWGYAWMIDDIELFDLPEASLALMGASSTDYNNSGEYEYGVYSPEQQATLNFRADIANMGSADQLGVTMTVSVNGTEAGTSAPTDVLYGETDSVYVNGYSVPTDAGDYTIDYMINMDAEDFDPSDNSTMGAFSVDQWQMGRDNGDFASIYPGETYDQVWRGGPLYNIFEDGTLYAIDVCLSEQSIPGSDLVGYIMDPAAEAIDQTDVFAQSEEIEVPATNLNTVDDEAAPKWTTLVLEEPMDVFAGDIIHATVGSFSGAGVSVLATPNTHDFSNYVYGDFGSAGETWYWTARNLMIRLNFNPDAELVIGVDEVTEANNFTLNQNFPNPATDNTRIAFELNEAGRVSLEVFDITGKVVMNLTEGLLPAGTHTMDINVSDLPAGVYQYSLIVDGERVTRPMMVK